MITAKDFILLPFTPDLTEGGIAYACRSLNYTYNRMSGLPYARLRRIVGGVAVELAFRHHLTNQDVPFDVNSASPFTEPDRYDVSLGGHRCDIKSFLIARRQQISDIRRDLSVLLKAPALIPSDHFAAQISLPPRQRIELDGTFFSLAYVHAKQIPSARIGVRSPVRKETYLIQSTERGNIWLYGMDIWLTGYISHEEFRHKAKHVPEGSRVFQYNVTRTKNLGVQVTELHPLGDLFENVKSWESQH